MKLHQARDGIQCVARDLAGWDRTLAGQLIAIADDLAAMPKQADELDNEDSASAALFDEHLERFPKSHAWWSPPQNMAINRALMAWNFWRFTILPMFPAKRAYREDLNGIVIRPTWHPASDKDVRLMTLDLAEKLLGHVRSSSTIQATVDKELAWVETKFGVKIPSAIKSKLGKDALAAAKRRWSANRLRLKDRFIPLDGGKSRDLGSWE